MTDARIEVTADGPFLLHGGVPLRTADYVYSNEGEPMTWSFGDVDADVSDDPVALCRCGGSSNKPFCDGTHQDRDWDSTDADQPAASYRERARHKKSPEGVDHELLDDTKLCMHAGQCGTAKTNVWKMMPATDDTETLGTVIRMVEKCPSGRLSNVIGGEVVEPALPEAVNVVPGGPLWVTGGLTVTTASGNDLERRNRVTLCRCGASSNKPLCDGTHADIDFDTDD